MTSREQSRLLELGQHPVDRGKPDVLAFTDQDPIHIFSREVAAITALNSGRLRMRLIKLRLFSCRFLTSEIVNWDSLNSLQVLFRVKPGNLS
jgi:hypothetical protein